MPMVSISVTISRTLEEIGAFSDRELLPSLISETIRVAPLMTTEAANALFKQVEATLAPLEEQMGPPSVYYHY